MKETLAPPQPKKKIRWILAIACLLLLAGSGWLYFVLATGGGDSYRLVMPGRASSGIFGPIPVEVAAESAKDGMAVKYLATSGEVSQVAFVRKERHAVKISVTAGKSGVAKDGLFYVIVGGNGEKLSEGKVTLDSSLSAGESGEGEISDLEIRNGRSIVINK